MSESAHSPWNDACLAAAALAVDPHALGGVALRAGPGPVRDDWLALLRQRVPARVWRRIPLHVSESRLLGGIDLAATLKRGAPVSEQGLLAECDGGIALLAMAERAARSTVAHVCAALDNGELTVERDTLRGRVPARIALVALDEGINDEHLSAPLRDRLAIGLDLHPLSIRDLDEAAPDLAAIDAAAGSWRDVHWPDSLEQTLCAAALGFGVESPRALVLARRLGKVLAALEGRCEVDESALAAVIRLGLLHRATRVPAANETEAEQEQQQPPEPEPDTPVQEAPDPQESQGQDRDDVTAPQDPREVPEQLLEATLAALPPGLLEALGRSASKRRRQAAAGKAGASQRHKQRGRPIGSIAGDPRGGGRLNLIATLRAAAPWQRLRRETDPRPGAGARGIDVRREDFRLVRFRQRAESTTLFVVDASGSSALHRLAEAKGAIELMLADCYIRRDQVALIAFRGKTAELLLPETRSLVRAKRSLAALPGGGGTPLAAAINLASAVVHQIQRRGGTPYVVLLTDGVANIALDGSPGREQASADALAAAALLRDADARGMVIDTSPRPQQRARELATALDAMYLPLPRADARTLRDAVALVSS